MCVPLEGHHIEQEGHDEEELLVLTQIELLPIKVPLVINSDSGTQIVLCILLQLEYSHLKCQDHPQDHVAHGNVMSCNNYKFIDGLSRNFYESILPPPTKLKAT